MKTSLLVLIFLSSFNLYAATVTVEPFELEFTMNTKAYELDFELTMACRYEKLVWSDSSQYNYKYKEVPLKIKTKKISNNESIIIVSNKSRQTLSETGYFRSNKGCQTYLNFFVKDKLYSIGWANQFHRPIRLGVFEHSRVEVNSVFDINKLKDIFENKKVHFNYKYVGRQVNVRLAFDGVSTTGMSTYLSQSVAGNSETEMPYPLKN